MLLAATGVSVSVMLLYFGSAVLRLGDTIAVMSTFYTTINKVYYNSTWYQVERTGRIPSMFAATTAVLVDIVLRSLLSIRYLIPRTGLYLYW